MNAERFVNGWASNREIPTLVCGIYDTETDSRQTISHEHSNRAQRHLTAQFSIASITKSLTALSVLTLADTGVLSLTDSLL